MGSVEILAPTRKPGGGGCGRVWRFEEVTCWQMSTRVNPSQVSKLEFMDLVL